jgi:hypothetical protein
LHCYKGDSRPLARGYVSVGGTRASACDRTDWRLKVEVELGVDLEDEMCATATTAVLQKNQTCAARIHGTLRLDLHIHLHL